MYVQKSQTSQHPVTNAGPGAGTLVHDIGEPGDRQTGETFTKQDGD